MADGGGFRRPSLPGGQTRLWQTHWLTWVQYPVIAIVGVLAGRALRFPLAFLLGPMLLSALWAALGVLPFERPFEGVAVLQVILGSSIGARMAQVSFAKLWRYVPMAYGVALFMLLCAAAGAWVFSLLTGQPFARSFISVSAGGASGCRCSQSRWATRLPSSPCTTSTACSSCSG